MTYQPPTLIGLTGRKKSGKDTLAAQLVDRHGYARVAFADALKLSAYNADPFIDTHDGKVVRLAQLVDMYGWDYCKNRFADARRFLQRHGVAMRDLVPGCWVNIAGRAIDAHRVGNGTPVVVTDVRFADEVHAITSRGGIVVRVNRAAAAPDVNDPNAQHVSETNVDTLPVDYDVCNDGPIESVPHLAAHVDNIARLRARGCQTTADWLAANADLCGVPA